MSAAAPIRGRCGTIGIRTSSTIWATIPRRLPTIWPTVALRTAATVGSDSTTCFGAGSPITEMPRRPSRPAKIRVALADHIERLTALGGDLEFTEDAAGGLELRAWLPDELEPNVAGSGEFLGRRSMDSVLG